ncbi:MAG: hypothetical protein ACLP1X_10840 [Polyangiaceae bacterium]
MIRDGCNDWAANLDCIVLVAPTGPGFALAIVIGPAHEYNTGGACAGDSP